MLPAVEENTGPSQKDKCRCAEVGDPACEEDSSRRASRRNAGIDSYVVDSHQDHHYAANEIDGCNPRVRCDVYLSRSGNESNTHDFASPHVRQSKSEPSGRSVEIYPSIYSTAAYRAPA